MPSPWKRRTLLLLLSALLSLNCFAKDTSIITQLAPGVWRIDTPDVQQKETNYPQITFAPGDSISVTAGGCVQTGGIGLTWKRYVDPSGKNSDHLYHGLIDLPGVTNGLVRLQDFGLDTPHAVPNPVPAASAAQGLYLRLGYEDDGYGDNGYSSHDNGTENQCKASKNAFVIISIAHNGTAPLASSFIGIRPSAFLCQAAWEFRNMDTSDLSLSSFKHAFDLHWYDYLDPATIITFLAARGNLASGGNCAGMSLLAEVAEDQFRINDLSENLYNNYKGNGGWQGLPASNVQFDINTAHWQQLSSYFLHYWLASAVLSPSQNAENIARDLAATNYNYGLVSIAHGSEGHVLTPIAVAHQANGDYLVSVYDSNRPCDDPQSRPPIQISGDSWSYQMADGSVWSGHRGGQALAYIPYRGPDAAWRKLGTNFSGLAGIVFGSGTTITQVTDSQGRTLYLNDGATLTAGVQSLSMAVLRVPMHGQATTTTSRRVAGATYNFATEAIIPPQDVQAAQAVQDKYTAAYSNSGTIFLVADQDLNDLTFQMATRPGVTSADVLVQQGRQFFAAHLTGSAGLAPSVTIHRPAALAANGISVQSRNTQTLQTAIDYGETSDAAQEVHVQHLLTQAGTVPLRVRLNGSSLVLSGNQATPAATVNEDFINQAGVRSLPARKLRVVLDPAAPR